MSRNRRIALAIVGLAILALSLAALAYAFWPLDNLQEGSSLAPTLFAPP